MESNKNNEPFKNSMIQNKRKLRSSFHNKKGRKSKGKSFCERTGEVEIDEINMQ